MNLEYIGKVEIICFKTHSLVPEAEYSRDSKGIWRDRIGTQVGESDKLHATLEESYQKLLAEQAERRWG